ncbi:MAG: SH3 domain-containing protein [Saprospiraceae bacterium]|nr:SH3 domain-containing protein [Saprospiraceae bacterium]
MKKNISVLLLFFYFVLPTKAADDAAKIILTKRAAVSVSGVRLYADSSYAAATETTFTEGEVFEVLGETGLEHLDNTQNQTFKWFKIRALNGTIGWIFGDNLAIVLPENSVESLLRPYFKKTKGFDNGFEKSTTWLAYTDGHDVKTKPALNPSYREFYLVVTNERGRCVLLNYANKSETNRKSLQSLYFRDVTENKIDEILIETTAIPMGSTLSEHVFEIYSFKSGALTKLFEERLTLTWETDVPAPSFSKFVEIEGKVIRVAYIDYINCDKFSLNLPTDVRSKTQERCLEYVTYSFRWDKIERVFKPLYPESRSSVPAIVSADKTPLKMTPSVSSTTIVLISPVDRLQVVKHFEVLTVENGEKKIDTWLYVKHPIGILGYVRGKDIQFKSTEHATVLNTYYQKPPLWKPNWRSEVNFVKMN